MLRVPRIAGLRARRRTQRTPTRAAWRRIRRVQRECASAAWRSFEVRCRRGGQAISSPDRCHDAGRSAWILGAAARRDVL